MKNILSTLTLLLLLTGSVMAIPKLNSYPSAKATIYLDFDGQTVSGTYWNNGNTLVCAATLMSDAQITEVFNRVSEDYRPFDVNITTDLAVFTAAPLKQRIRVIVTPTSSWYQGVGGIAYVGSFTWGDDTPCFVFSDRLGPNNPKYIGECCSHESGHTLGLSHQSTYNASCQLVETYATGTGTGETSWAPIMGNSYYKNMTGWDLGPTPYGCSVVQDNLTIITSQNGFTYRTDDFADVVGNQSQNVGNSSFTTAGIIGTNADKDAFRLDVPIGGVWHFEVLPFVVNAANQGANLDVRVDLYDKNKNLIRTYDPLSTMKVIIDTTLATGYYYLVVSGTGNMNVDDYGSLGSYTLMGLKGALPIRDVSLSGNISNSKHNLSWSITSDEPIKTLTIEYSEDGRDYRSLIQVDPLSKSYSYMPFSNKTIYYRLKAVSVIDQTAYSNIYTLKSDVKSIRPFLISTLVSDNINVNASEEYTFRLSDANGRTLSSGKGAAGQNRINVLNQPAGMYILQIFTANQRIAERIIKQ